MDHQLVAKLLIELDLLVECLTVVEHVVELGGLRDAALLHSQIHQLLRLLRREEALAHEVFVATVTLMVQWRHLKSHFRSGASWTRLVTQAVLALRHLLEALARRIFGIAVLGQTTRTFLLRAAVAGTLDCFALTSGLTPVAQHFTQVYLTLDRLSLRHAPSQGQL